MNVSRLRCLADRWRSEAELYDRRGLAEAARLAGSYAADLTQELDEWLLEGLTLAEAAEEAGLSYSAIQKQVARGDLPNAGRDGSPRVRRCDLLGAPVPLRLETTDGSPDVASEVLGRRALG